MTYRDPWGPSRASRFVPPEQDSPRGPRFQPARWDPASVCGESPTPCRAACNAVGECEHAREGDQPSAQIALLLAGVLWPAAHRRRRSL
jgi:MYXO-CTERM domain-containing protein